MKYIKRDTEKAYIFSKDYEAGKTINNLLIHYLPFVKLNKMIKQIKTD